MNLPRTDSLRDRLKAIREEAHGAKACFTTISFQAIAAGSISIAAIIANIEKYPSIGLAGLPLAYLMVMVIRVGNYKFMTANRNYGYELHIHRALLYGNGKPELEDSQSTKQILEIGWEEAMFAWRIVKPAMFKKVYNTEGGHWSFWGLKFLDKPVNAVRDLLGRKCELLRWKYQPKMSIEEAEYAWWDTQGLLGEGAHEPGGYLKTMQHLLATLAIVSLVPAIYCCIYYWSSSRLTLHDEFFYCVLGSLATLVALLHITLKIRRDLRFRKILETGMDSMQAQAVVWRCTIVAHFRALENRHHFYHYTDALGKEADELKKKIEEVHQWLENDKSFPKVPFSGLKPFAMQSPFTPRPKKDVPPSIITRLIRWLRGTGRTPRRPTPSL